MVPLRSYTSAVLTLTLKNIPAQLHAKLKDSALKNRRSLNSEILTRLERDVSVPKVDGPSWRAISRHLPTGFPMSITGSAIATNAKGSSDRR